LNTRQAQRDMSCRYTVGAYIDPKEIRVKQSVSVRVNQPDIQTRHPEMIQLFTEEEKQENRSRAAFVDPGPYENPLVRAFAYPVYPANASKWDTLLAFHFPMPVGSDGADVNVAATLRRGATRVDKTERTIHVDPPADGGDTRPVTVFGDSKLQNGDHTLTVVLTQPDQGKLVAAEAHFHVPEVLTNLLILRGPLFARAIPGGMLVRGDPKDKANDTKLDEILGEDKSFEPLVINEINPSDELLYYWNACVIGKLDLKGNAIVKRILRAEDGEIIREFPVLPLTLAPQPTNKKAKCHISLDTVPADTIPPGEYEFDVMITYENGDMISRGRAPLHVKDAGE
jgi:hypothetical protein